jgi:hypothetical protein
MSRTVADVMWEMLVQAGVFLKDDPERWIVASALGTGPREGERWRLHLSDVHVEESLRYSRRAQLARIGTLSLPADS